MFPIRSKASGALSRELKPLSVPGMRVLVIAWLMLLLSFAPLAALLLVSLGLVVLKRRSGVSLWMARLAAPPFYPVSLPIATLLRRDSGAPAQPQRKDVERYAFEKWGNLDSPEAKAFMANFEQAFGSYPQHVDLNKLHPLPTDGSIPAGKDVSLFVGRNGEVLYYERDPAPGGTGALCGIYGLDGSPGDTKSLPGVAGLDRAPKGSGPPGLALEGEAAA
jgi:hypothetical protein